MNILHNARFSLIRAATSVSAGVNKYLLARWITVSGSFFMMREVEKQARIQLSASGVAAFGQIVLAAEVKVLRGDTLLSSFVQVASSGPTMKSKVLGWTGTADKPTNPVASWSVGEPVLAPNWVEIAADAVVPNNINNLFQLFYFSGTNGQYVTIDRAYLGDAYVARGFANYLDEVRNCSFFYQLLSTNWHANEMIAWGRTLNPTQMHVEFPLPHPIRGADGAAGVDDVSVDWGGTFNATNGLWWGYGFGKALRMVAKPVLTCVHRNFLGFTITCATGFAANHAGVIRSYYPTQAAINASTVTIAVDAELYFQ